MALALTSIDSCSKSEEGPTKEELAGMEMPGYEMTSEYYWYNLNGDKK